MEQARGQHAGVTVVLADSPDVGVTVSVFSQKYRDEPHSESQFRSRGQQRAVTASGST